MSSCFESQGKRYENLVSGSRYVVGPVIFKEVQAVLTINTKHSNKVGRVDAITEELNSHAALHIRGLGIDWDGAGHADEARVTSLKDTSVGVATKIDPLDLAHITDRVNGLVTATSQTAVKLVTLNFKDLVLSDK